MLTEDILEWIKTLPKWQQRLGYYIVENNEISEDIIEDVYDEFKVEMSLDEGKINDEIEEKFEFENDVNPKIKWLGVKNVHGVNKLKNNANLIVSEGITVIYGENGSGKSGYTRLLNKAFISRGDQEILPNIYSENQEDLAATFSFSVDDEMKEYKYPEKKNEAAFRAIRNFDSKSASDDMNNESTIDFAPSELSFFDILLSASNEIQSKLEEERESKKKENPTLKFFPNEGKALNIMKELSADSNIEVIKEEFCISEEEKKKYEELKKEKANLIALDINSQSILIDQVIEILNKALDKYDSFKKYMSQNSIDIFNQQIETLKKNRQILDTDGMTLFQNEDIEYLGTAEWKEFISAAKNYYDEISNHEKCPLCGQVISEKDLIFKYWKYLESDAEKNYKTLEEAVRVSKERLKELDLSFIIEYSVHEQWLIDNFKEETEKIKKIFEDADKKRKQIVSDFEEEKTISVDSLQNPDIQGLLAKVNAKKSDLNQEYVNNRISECQKIENEYVDKTKVIDLLPVIEEYIKYLKWDALAIKSKIKTRNITNKHKELFEKYVTEDYVNTFKEECKKLNADFNVEISSRGRNGQTLKKLQIKGNVPGKILSEGEQRAIAIANFLTEVSMDKRNIGIVLDDPVCSLDHKRRSYIAVRLLEEAKKRQVVVFTHEITFFMELKYEADKRAVPFMQQTIRNFSNEPGDISTAIPWQGMNVKDRVRKLNNELQGITSVYNAGDMDSYYYKAKEWCELLRESWERAVEEILLNDAIQRYNPCVQTQRLKRAPFSTELYDELEKGMDECSAWCHDQARAINGKIPTAEELKGYIDCFEKYCKKHRPK